MYYWNRDLVSDLENNVPTSTADPAFWQHMVTFGLSIGQQGNLDPSTDLPSIINGTKSWGNPNDAEDADRIDDLWHASVNGHGSFLAAASPTEFAQGLISCPCGRGIPARFGVERDGEQHVVPVRHARLPGELCLRHLDRRTGRVRRHVGRRGGDARMASVDADPCHRRDAPRHRSHDPDLERHGRRGVPDLEPEVRPRPDRRACAGNRGRERPLHRRLERAGKAQRRRIP